MSATPQTAEELRAAQADEYGTYVALGPIFVNGARAFNKGDAVPVSHVQKQVVPQDMVAKATTKTGRAAAGLTDESKG